VLFASRARLASYNNAGQGELYLYDAASGGLACVSCNPSGAPAISEAHLAGNLLTTGIPGRNAFLTRNLSDDGSRVFFQTQEALLPQDKNGQIDVYEWEREGAGGAYGCTRSSASFSESSGGCLYPISTGESASPSYFGDASASGNDVFFFTSQPLVGQDQDQLIDLYDARVNGGVAAQNASPPPPCEGEACRGTESSAPAFGAPSSTTLAGVGNLAPPPVLASAPSKVVPKSVMRAQKLAKALKVCKKKPKKRQGSCEAQAKKRYGKSSKARKSIRVRKSHKGAK